MYGPNETRFPDPPDAVKTSQTTQIFLAHSLVDGGSTADTFAVVVSRVGPPVGLHLDVAQNHVLDRSRQSGYFPRNISLPAAPGFRQMLQDGSGFVLLDTFGHHVQNVVHN